MSAERIDSEATQEADWTRQASKLLKGRTIVKVRIMTREEADASLWSERAFVLQLDDDTLLWPSQDDEGNGAGALFTTSKDLPTLPVFS